MKMCERINVDGLIFSDDELTEQDLQSMKTFKENIDAMRINKPVVEEFFEDEFEVVQKRHRLFNHHDLVNLWNESQRLAFRISRLETKLNRKKYVHK